MTVFTLSGPAPSGPTGIAAADTKAMAKQILQRAETPLVGFEPGGYLGNLVMSAASVVNEASCATRCPPRTGVGLDSTEDQAALAVIAMQRPDLAGMWFRIGEQYAGAELAEAVGEAVERAVRYVPLIRILQEHRQALIAERLALGPAWTQLDLVFPSRLWTAAEPRNVLREFHALGARAGLPAAPFRSCDATPPSAWRALPVSSAGQSWLPLWSNSREAVPRRR